MAILFSKSSNSRTDWVVLFSKAVKRHNPRTDWAVSFLNTPIKCHPGTERAILFSKASNSGTDWVVLFSKVVKRHNPRTDWAVLFSKAVKKRNPRTESCILFSDCAFEDVGAGGSGCWLASGVPGCRGQEARGEGAQEGCHGPRAPDRGALGEGPPGGRPGMEQRGRNPRRGLEAGLVDDAEDQGDEVDDEAVEDG